MPEASWGGDPSVQFFVVLHEQRWCARYPRYARVASCPEPWPSGRCGYHLEKREGRKVLGRRGRHPVLDSGTVGKQTGAFWARNPDGFRGR